MLVSSSMCFISFVVSRMCCCSDWSLWLLKWFMGSLTLCRNFLSVCRFCLFVYFNVVFLFSLTLFPRLSCVRSLFIWRFSPRALALWQHTFILPHSFAFIAPKTSLSAEDKQINTNSTPDCFVTSHMRTHIDVNIFHVSVFPIMTHYTSEKIVVNRLICWIDNILITTHSEQPIGMGQSRKSAQ